MARTKPLPRSQRKTVKRQTQFKREDNIQDISVSLMDMDSTIMYYFENVIKMGINTKNWIYEGCKTTSYFTCYSI